MAIDDLVAVHKTLEQYPDAGALVTTNEERSLISVIKSKIMLPKTLREVVLKARKFSASEAFDHGFVDGVYEDFERTLEAATLEDEKLASRNGKRDSYANFRSGAFAGVIEELEARRDPFVWTLGSKL
ncbi:hypothetical protein NE237_010581 [Protea cynaroides]|uniref:Uncharacterized protein n=1 Tax=Protea cynaroides TaxID=273540 RepID=A0A9Q0L0I0_9MAGN|nr:hypothetical protein NE237_010581 [Protea cynaroides]